MSGVPLPHSGPFAQLRRCFGGGIGAGSIMASSTAPSPILAGLEAPNDGMLRLVKVSRGVLVRRVVAASDMPAQPLFFPPEA
jgi:hypothetical protein